ncbi:hypothetical protein [Microbacterium saperdae]|nr:hypothetical protein [Microbacterium saperdae]
MDALRALLRSQGAVPEEEGPEAAATAVEAENTPTPSQEHMMNKNQDTVVPQFSSTAVIQALAVIDALPHDKYFHFEPGDELYQEIPAVVVKPLAWMGSDPVGWDQDTWVHRVLPLDLEGRKVDVLGAEWDDALSAAPPGLVATWRVTANAAIRIGDLLVISLGQFFPHREVEVDGAPMVELVTFAETLRRKQEAKTAWLDAHPTIAAHKPGWAERVIVEAIDERNPEADVEIWFERDFGPVHLTKCATYNGGTLTWADGSDAPSIHIDRDKREDMTLDGMRELAFALPEAISVVEAASA